MCPLNRDITKVLYSCKSTNKQAQYDLKGDFLIKICLFFSSPHLDIFRVGKHLSSVILPSYSRFPSEYKIAASTISFSWPGRVIICLVTI